MPRAPKKCGAPQCEVRVVATTYCDEHKPLAWRTKSRPGSTRQSRTLREQVLRRDPVCKCSGCRRCTATGCDRPSTDDDHIVNVTSGGSDDIANHQGLCHPCHGVKTQREAAAARRAAAAQ
ncbi:HNH endonuclease signature motif containing protein [Frigoribacterium sp. VKM Ac-2530]|uniref:HNH endonuclease signature motif containing protein n=1 Tax=Frigoribacterium sp. VKM Ac-2530 TaxID=2783822 RepID=UPI00188B3621|nr:HNH endonuclease [Frigoribacterium sp. VKM Ac-2530]